jgi:hypothetical protein
MYILNLRLSSLIRDNSVVFRFNPPRDHISCTWAMGELIKKASLTPLVTTTFPIFLRHKNKKRDQRSARDEPSNTPRPAQENYKYWPGPVASLKQTVSHAPAPQSRTRRAEEKEKKNSQAPFFSLSSRRPQPLVSRGEKVEAIASIFSPSRFRVILFFLSGPSPLPPGSARVSSPPFWIRSRRRAFSPPVFGVVF